MYWDNRTAGPTITAFERRSSPDGGLAGMLGIQIDIPLPPDTAEIRIDLAAEGSLKTASIYARLRSDQRQSAPSTAGTARVSLYMSPAARERLGIRPGDPGANGA